MNDIGTKVAQLVQLRSAIRDMEAAAKVLSGEIAAELPHGGKAAGCTITVSPSRRFDDDKALDLLASAPRETRERCVSTVSREVVDRKAVEVLAPDIFEQAWKTGAPVVKVTEP